MPRDEGACATYARESRRSGEGREMYLVLSWSSAGGEFWEHGGEAKLDLMVTTVVADRRQH